ncbi:UNKNOWN [Stylonychia lemnae]|uniref:Uncharacterized protein n=1 Tax=Stylonychia lemnae TaxID=5949 RepID=A0A078AY34_STYLE|nr:UNKNOWN [Stylonychia lemnae]|eukprot:CDW87031.1 UNKNOWN [Stylonychia lemnae]
MKDKKLLLKILLFLNLKQSYSPKSTYKYPSTYSSYYTYKSIQQIVYKPVYKSSYYSYTPTYKTPNFNTYTYYYSYTETQGNDDKQPTEPMANPMAMIHYNLLLMILQNLKAI